MPSRKLYYGGLFYAYREYRLWAKEALRTVLRALTADGIQSRGFAMLVLTIIMIERVFAALSEA